MALRVVPATSESRVEGTIVSHIREGLEKDPLAKNILRLVEEGKTPRFWVKGGLLMTKGRRMYVPKVGELRKTLLHECHDTPWAGHPGWHRTLALLERRYSWPNMRDEVEEYVTTSLICQQDKTERASWSTRTFADSGKTLVERIVGLHFGFAESGEIWVDPGGRRQISTRPLFPRPLHVPPKKQPIILSGMW